MAKKCIPTFSLNFLIFLFLATSAVASALVAHVVAPIANLVGLIEDKGFVTL